MIISLFTDRRADDDDDVDPHDRRGYWGDAYAAVPGDRVGSRLWLLARAKMTTETLQRAVTYAQKAMQWLVTDRIAESVRATAEWRDRGVLLLTVEIQKPAKIAPRWRRTWEVQINAL